MQVVVGSCSKIKVTAAQQAFPGAKVTGLNIFESGVPPQPVGKEETQKGAEYRAQAALKEHPEAQVALGIENGMFKDDAGKWVDAACIVIYYKPQGEDKYQHAVIWSDTLDIPSDCEKGPNGEWSILKDPHVVFTNGKRPRAKFISDAITEWITKNNIKF